MGRVWREITSSDHMIREFDGDISDDSLVWHRDEKDRLVIPIHCEGWMFQMDNEAPFEMRSGHPIKIKAETYHRIIKGSGKLVLKIFEG